MQPRIIIPDTFILVDRESTRGVRETEPVLVITTSKGAKGGRIVIPPLLLKMLGFNAASAKRTYCQLFISANTLKLVGCSAYMPGARLVTTSGYISAKEVRSLLHLPEDVRLRCKAEVVRNKSWEIWATYPKELRDHIEKLNGVNP